MGCRKTLGKCCPPSSGFVPLLSFFYSVSILRRGNWIPLSKALVKKLPTTREFSEVEAMFSLTVNYDCANPTSISGLASRWMWSRKRVSNFLKKHGVTVDYGNKFNPKKKGQVGYQVGNRLGTGSAQVEFIDSKDLGVKRNRSGTGREQVGNRLGSSIKEPNPKPNPKPKDITTDEQKAFAFRLSEIASLRREINITPSTLSSWANTIRLMMDRDSISPAQISKALEWYQGNWMNEYVPVIESASSLRGKWPKLLNAIDRAKKTPTGDTHNGFSERDYRAGATKFEDIPDFLRPDIE